jgi:hypothetical protein
MARTQTNIAFYTILAIVAVVLCGIAAWYATMFQSFFAKEAFQGGVEGFSGLNLLSSKKGDDCPLSAERKEDGKIHVQPQNRAFDTMADYVAWLSSLSAAGSTCVPPYVSGPRNVEMTGSGGATDAGISPSHAANQNKSGNVFTKQVEGEQPFAKTPINKADDYEYTRIFQNENSPRGEISKTAVNSMLAKKQWDWAQLPFNSSTRADAEDQFNTARADSAQRDPKSGVFFKNVEGADIKPPDVVSIEQTEKAGLKPFVERPAEKLLEHNIEDVGEMVRKMYADDPNWEPVVEKIGENEYRVSELRPKPRKEHYAGAEEPTIERAKANGMISAEVDVEGGRQDPYFDKQGVLDYGNDRFWEYKDFKKWTPGLERMFAPSLDTTNWA